MSIQRINLLGVPVDICGPENLENEILEILAKPGTKQIIFLSIWDLLKARGKNDFSECENCRQLRKCLCDKHFAKKQRAVESTKPFWR